MKLLALSVSGLGLVASYSAGGALRVGRAPQGAVSPVRMAEVFDQEAFIAESKEMRLKHLEEQAMFALKIACENYGNAVFPNAMIAGDVVITHLLGRLGYLESGKCKVMVVDTFHLFPETMSFLGELESHYKFKANRDIYQVIIYLPLIPLKPIIAPLVHYLDLKI